MQSKEHLKNQLDKLIEEIEPIRLETLDRKKERSNKTLYLVLIIILSFLVLPLIPFATGLLYFLFVNIESTLEPLISLFSCSWTILIICTIVYLIVYTILFAIKTYKIEDEYKVKIIEKTIEIINKDRENKIHLNLNKGLTREEYRTCPYVPKHDVYNARKKISFEKNGSKTEVTDVITRLQKKKGTESSYWVTTFNGIVIKTEFPRNFNNNLYITSDTKKIIPGGFLGIGTDIERIKLEDPNFEKNFNVFGYDQVEARYILSLDFMEAITNQLKDKTCYIWLNTKYIYIAIDKIPMDIRLPHSNNKESLIDMAKDIFAFIEKSKEYIQNLGLTKR